ncbi:MAG: hypothetical protein AB8I08_36350 [Sandaracinaceae bacterium]
MIRPVPSARLARSAALAFLALVGCCASTASAQSVYRVEAPAGTVSEEDFSAARDAFEAGTTYVDEGRWSDALSRFEESYRLSGFSGALFNVGTTLRSMGRHRDARDVFTQLLELDDLDEETRTTAQARLYEESGRLARLTLHGLETSQDAEVRLDGRSVDVARWDPVELELDAGDHGLVVMREGFQPFRELLTLADAERRRVNVELVAIATPAPIVVTTTETDDGVWALVIAAVSVAVIGAAIGISLFVYDDQQLSPQPGFDVFTVDLN